MNLRVNADTAVEGEEVGAAAEEDVLAVVDDFVDAGVEIGGGAAAEVAAAFDELDVITGFGEGAGGADASDAGSDDGDGRAVGLDSVWQGRFQGLKPLLFYLGYFGMTEVMP